MTEATGPLVGLRVIDLGMIFAGPLVATNLGDLGAEVIKIEHPRGDDVRKTGRFKDGRGLWWCVCSRNKRLISVDVSKPTGAEIVKRLAQTADVFIENFRPGRMKEWGLDYETLSAGNRGLVMLHISGYGQTGPYSRRPGMGTLAEAFSGFAHITGEADGPPTLPAIPLADGVAAMTGTYAVLAALFARERNGGIGDEIDLSLYEPLLALLGSMVIDYDQLGHIMQRRGNRSTWTVPRNAYRTRDEKWVAVSSAANSIAPRLFRAIGRDDLANDPTLATNPQRLKRVDECDGAIAKWVSEHTLEEVLGRFHEFDVVAGPVYDVAQIFADPQVRHRGTLTETEDPALGKVKVQNVVPRLRRNSGRIRWLGKPDIGADTRAVLEEIGYSNEDIGRLESDGVIKTASGNAVRSNT
ncbi:MAG: CoA transferase [Betaproteobacteria bacterium]|nr:CoA transferase [Betaproteobacteria bacterium]